MITAVSKHTEKNAIAPPKKLFEGKQLWEPEVTGKTMQHWREKDRDVPGTTSFFGNGWTNFNTPLSNYAGRLMEPEGEKYLESFNQYLLELVHVKQNPSVLDVGGGGFRQWLNFLERHPQINFSGTALTMKMVTPEMQPMVKISTAGDIYRHYEKASFDLISTHWGAYQQNMALIENAMELLKLGGDLILAHPVTYSGYRIAVDALSHYENKILRVVSNKLYETQTDTYCFSYSYTLQIRKLSEP
jgi:hypothetical protein